MLKTLRYITLTGVMFLSMAMSVQMAQADPWRKQAGQGYPAYNQNYMPQAPRTMPQRHAPVPQWAQRKISYSEAKAIAQKRYPGAEVNDIILERDVYRVLFIIKNGQVVDLLIDAYTGQIK